MVIKALLKRYCTINSRHWTKSKSYQWNYFIMLCITRESSKTVTNFSCWDMSLLFVLFTVSNILWYLIWTLQFLFPSELLHCQHISSHLPAFTGLILKALSISSYISQGVFVQLVQANSPAALAGLRFGDQVLQINGQNCAGWSADKAHKALKAAAETRIELVVRDRWGVFLTAISVGSSLTSFNVNWNLQMITESLFIFHRVHLICF